MYIEKLPNPPGVKPTLELSQEDYDHYLSLLKESFQEGYKLITILENAKIITEAKVVNKLVEKLKFREEWNGLPTNNVKSQDNLKNYLINYPDRHNEVIPEFNTLRKLRWNLEGTSNKASNTGAVRIINAYIHDTSEILLLTCYHKDQIKKLPHRKLKFLDEYVKDYINQLKKEGKRK